MANAHAQAKAKAKAKTKKIERMKNMNKMQTDANTTSFLISFTTAVWTSVPNMKCLYINGVDERYVCSIYHQHHHATYLIL